MLPTPEDNDEEDKAFTSCEGKCSVVDGDKVGGGEQAKHVGQYIADTGASCHMTPDADGLTNYRECSRPIGLANGENITIAGYGDLVVAFRTDDTWVDVQLHNVAHAPQLSYNLISLTSLAKKGHMYVGVDEGITLKLEGGGEVHFPLLDKLCRQDGYRPEAKDDSVDIACAVIAPGKAKENAPNPPPSDINLYHCTYHTHERLLKKTAKQQGVSLSGELHECQGCSMAKGLRNSIARSTHTRAAKKLNRVFVDLSGKTVSYTHLTLPTKA